MYHVDITHKKDFTFAAQSAQYEFSIDIKGDGATPPDVLLASLGSCIGVYIRKYAAGAHLPLEGFTVKLDAELTKEPPMCFKVITVAVDLKGAALDDRRKHALLEFIKNCPVHNTLHSNPEVVIKLIEA